jgi:sulfite reductase alpha subunit-like flavoprotein
VSAAAAAAAAAVPSGPPLLILYGSQTGCAQEVAERFARAARLQRLFSRVRVVAADAFDRRALPSTPLLLLVASTSGQGDAPDNCKQLYRFLLRRDLPTDSLSATRFAVFGLGDSSYPLFNAIARRLHVRLQELGAAPVLERGLADDQDARGVDQALEPWMDSLWEHLAALYPRPAGVQPTRLRDAPPPPPKFHVELLPKGEPRCEEAVREQQERLARARASSTLALGDMAAPTAVPPELPPSGSMSSLGPFPVRLLRNDRLTPASHFQDVRLVELEVPSASVQQTRLGWPVPPPTAKAALAAAPTLGAFAYESGDVLSLHARNVLSAAEEAWLSAQFGLPELGASLDSFVQVWRIQEWRAEQARRGLQPEPVSEEEDAEDEVADSPFPRFCRVRDLFTHWLDVHGTPRRSVLQSHLVHWARGEPASVRDAEAERLLELSDPANEADWNRYCVREKRTFVELMQDFPHCVPPTLDALVSLVPPLRPREFSIASSPLAHVNSVENGGGGRIQLLVALLAFKTPMGRQRTGVCSQWLQQLDTSGGTIYVSASIKRSTLPGSFRPPTNPRVPVVMLGPGTGIAPFRSMCWTRAAQKREEENRAYEMEPNADTDDEAQQRAISDRTRAQTAEDEAPSSPPPVLPAPMRPFTVVFGNRNAAADFFFRDEWEQLGLDQERVVDFHAAFSRDEPSPAQEAAEAASDLQNSRRLYVQHVLERDLGASVARMLLREEGVVMVAGSAGQMTRDVRAAFVRLLQQHAHEPLAAAPAAAFAHSSAAAASSGSQSSGSEPVPWTEEQAKEYLKLMDRKKRYLVEAW